MNKVISAEVFVARFSEAGTERCNLYLSAPVNFPKLEGNEDSYPELGRSSNSPLLCILLFFFFFLVRIACYLP